MTDSLVSTQWLADNLNLPGLRIVDASWHMPGDGRDARAEYAAGHIPGALFLDMASLADPTTSLPMMLPDPVLLAARMESLGISNHDWVILYDNSPFKTATRAWWMLARVSGMPHVTIMDGNLAKWQAEGHAVETATQPIVAGRFSPAFDSHAVRDKAAINANLVAQAEQLIDARSAARFAGEEAESRPNLVAGHIPGSLNLPYVQLFDADGCWKPADGLRAAFVEAGVDWNRPIVTTCGSGITAAILTFALHLIGKDDVALYDGSWTEWGSDPATPKAQGRP